MMSTATTTAASPPPASSHVPQEGDVMLMPAPRVSVLTFAVAVPAPTTMDVPVFSDDYYEEDEISTKQIEESSTLEDDFTELAIQARSKQNRTVPQAMVQNDTAMKGFGMVGTITVLESSYMIWFGWGQLLEGPESGGVVRTGVNHSRLVGNTAGSQANRMGQLIIAMPPKRFPGGGAFTSPAGSESSTSKLIGDHGSGSTGSSDSMVAGQMAARLSAKCQKPVLVSCHLDPGHIQAMGLDPDLLHARAAALAEQRIWSILQQHEKL